MATSEYGGDQLHLTKHPRKASWGRHLRSVRHTPEPKRGRARLAHTKMHLKSKLRLKVQEAVR